MATPIWPSILPQDVLLDGYGETALMPKYSVQTDNSMPIERPKTTLKATKIECQIDMTSDQLQSFEDFVFYDLGQSAIPFLMFHPRLRRQVRCVMSGDQPYTLSKMSPTAWKVQLSLTVYP